MKSLFWHTERKELSQSVLDILKDCNIHFRIGMGTVSIHQLQLSITRLHFDAKHPIKYDDCTHYSLLIGLKVKLCVVIAPGTLCEWNKVWLTLHTVGRKKVTVLGGNKNPEIRVVHKICILGTSRSNNNNMPSLSVQKCTVLWACKDSSHRIVSIW